MPRRIFRGSWSEIDPYIEGFEREMSARGAAQIADYLPGPHEEIYPAVLRELVRSDLEFHWGQGKPKLVESYLVAFPCLAEDPAGLSEIAFEEFRLRRRAGETPSPDEYLSRLGVDLRPHTLPPSPPPAGSGTDRDLGPDGLPAIDRSRPRRAGFDMLDAIDLIEGGPWFEGFQPIAELGRGGFGRVFLARQADLADRCVVLKVGADLFGEELSLAQLQHSNIVPVHSVHRAGPLQAICMPYFGATTFADVLRELRAGEAPPTSGRWLTELVRRGRRTAGSGTEAALLDLEQRSYIDAILTLAAQLAEALAHAHERGIIHRDLKPANLLLSDEGRPMILDFNLSADPRRATGRELIGGTMPYMAPECLAGFRDGSGGADASGDVYALGVVLYELLCGVSPFPVAEGTVKDFLDHAIRERHQPLPDPRRRNPAISPAVASMLAHCLEPDPARRYRSANELRVDLQRHLSHLPLRFAPDPSPRERASKWVRRHPKLTSSYAVATIGATLLVVLGLLYARRGHQVAVFEAAENLRHFRDEAKTGRFLLISASAFPDEKTKGLELLRGAAARFHVRDRRDWLASTEFAMLSRDLQSQARSELAEVLLYLAAEAGDRAAIAPAADQRVPREEALRWNDLAATCSADGAGQPAIRFQRDRLLRKAGGATPAIAVEPPLLDGKTQWRYYLAAYGRMTPDECRAVAQSLRRAIKLDVQDPFIYYALGNCELILKHPEQAKAHLDTSIALWPRFYRSYFLRAGANHERKDYQAALEDFDEAIRLRPEFFAAYADRARTRAELGDYNGAINDLTWAIEGGQPTRLYFLRALFRQEAGDSEGAARDYQEGLTRTPNDEDSWVARGLERLNQSSSDALADFDEALKLDPRHIPALEAKANALGERLGRLEEAIRVLDDAVKYHPTYPPVRSGRGVYLARLGRRESALIDARESLRLVHESEVTYQVAGIYALTSRQVPADGAEALRLLQLALQQGFGTDLIERDSDLDPIRSLPEFRRLAEAAKSPRHDHFRSTP
jgi:serine/threonine protein kinase/tetratricopeptide (TPR) repeat protein